MIDLPVYLAQQGFALVPDGAGIVGLVFAAPGDRSRLVLQQASEREAWTYFPVDRPDERGTITDFLERENGLDRAACLERLIALVGGRRSRHADVVAYRAGLACVPAELRRAQRTYQRAATRLRDANKLLERVGIRRAGLDEWRFGSLSAPEEVTRMLEVPDGLWISRYQTADRRLVFTERPIDAVSLEQGSHDGRTCYVALGKMPDRALGVRIRGLLAGVPGGVAVVLAFGRDREGRQLADAVQALAPSVWMERLAPAYGTRWNDQVRLELRHAQSMPCRDAAATGSPR